jgi:hypothetical protein
MSKKQVILIILVLFIIWKFIPCDRDAFRGGRSSGGRSGGRSSGGRSSGWSSSSSRAIHTNSVYNNQYKKPFNLFTYIKNKFKK